MRANSIFFGIKMQVVVWIGIKVAIKLIKAEIFKKGMTLTKKVI